MNGPFFHKERVLLHAPSECCKMIEEANMIYLSFLEYKQISYQILIYQQKMATFLSPPQRVDSNKAIFIRPQPVAVALVLPDRRSNVVNFHR